MFYNKKIFKRCFNFKGKQSWKNMKEIPRYCYLMKFLVKNGYDEYATWETFNWFIITMKDILTRYKERDSGTPCVLGDDVEDIFSDEAMEQNEKEWNHALDEMLSLLDKMNEKTEYKERCAAKDRFFVLFSHYFYNLWD